MICAFADDYFVFSVDALPISTSRSQPSSGVESGKENKTDTTAAARKPQRWRAAAAFKERGKLFTPRKAASNKIPYLRNSFNFGSKVSKDSNRQLYESDKEVQASSLPDSDQDHSSRAGSKNSSRGTNSKEGTCKQDNEAEVNSMMTPAKGQGASHSQKTLATTSFSQRSLQPSNAGASTPAATAAAATVSKLWSILKSGAKRGLASKPADMSSSPGLN